jgi:hypothetical protein
MKTHRHSRSTRSARDPGPDPKQVHEPTLRACESAASRLKAAGDELAAPWSALCLEISSGVSPTDLLRKRAWCNVLELRLKEQAHALEQARHNVDSIWDELMGSRSPAFFGPLIRKSVAAARDAESLPLLARSVSASHSRRSATLKKQLPS